ncbi:MAG: hypothetical protein AB1921_12410 [Thermodesulfobacteriota bacterium]
MRKLLVIFLIGLCSAGFGCMGGSPGAKTPRHLTAGERQAEAGMQWYARGCYERALEHFLRAHELFVAADQQAAATRALNNMANAYRALGDPQTAGALYTEAAVGFLDQGDNSGRALAMANNASVMLDIDRPQEAQALLDQAQALLGPADKTARAAVSMTRAVMASRAEDQDTALALYNEALADTAPDDEAGRAAIFYGQGKAMLAQKKSREALARFLTARDLDGKLGNTKALADDLLGAAMAQEDMGNAREALSLYKRAAFAYTMAEKQDQANQTLAKVNELAEKTGQPATIPNLFVEKYLSGKAYEYPCRR